MMKVSDYIADFIARQGVKKIFMLSGSGSVYLDDSIAGKNLDFICVRNEATAPMMAESYARLTGKLGVACITSGPGGTNAVSGLSEAWVDSAPVLVISGQVDKKHTCHKANIKNLRSLGIQEIDIIPIVNSLTKYAQMVEDPDSIRYHLEKAVYLAKSGRPGPVWLDIPLDVQSSIIDEKMLEGWNPEASEKDLDKNKLKEAVMLLAESKRPLIIAGQGIRIAKSLDEFKNLIEKLKIPVILSRLGQDMLPFSYRYNLGHGGMKGLRYTKLIMSKSDLILSLGSRLAVPFVSDALSESAKIIMVDIDEAELKKPSIRVDLQINSDVKEFIEGLLKEDVKVDASDWLKDCQGYKESYPLAGPARNPIDLYYFVSRLDALSKENSVFVSDAGSSYYVTGQALRFEKGQREITSGAFASMGLAIPLAIGSASADPSRQILAITGDGSLELNIQELKTMSSCGLDIKLFVINNGGYVSIRNTQDALCGGRHVGSGQAEGLNFKKIADAFELPYESIQNYEEVDGKITEILNKKGPVFIEVVSDNCQKIIEPIKQI